MTWRPHGGMLPPRGRWQRRRPSQSEVAKDFIPADGGDDSGIDVSFGRSKRKRQSEPAADSSTQRRAAPKKNGTAKSDNGPEPQSAKVPHPPRLSPRQVEPDEVKSPHLKARPSRQHHQWECGPESSSSQKARVWSADMGVDNGYCR